MSETEGLVSRLRDLMGQDPQAGAIEFNDGWVSWDEMAAAIARMDDVLHTAGLGRDAPIGMLLRNRPAHLCAALGVLLSQRCVLTINPFQSPESLGSGLAQLRAPVLVMDAQEWALPSVQAAAGGALVLLIGQREGTITIEPVPGFEVITLEDSYPAQPGVGILMLSSGTTGVPKRVPLPFASFERSIMGAAFYESGDGGAVKVKRTVAFLFMPLVHIGGLWVAVLNLASGRPVVLFEKFAVPVFERAMLRHRPKLVSLPPSAIHMVYEADVPKSSLESLIAIRAGSAPLDPGFAERFEQRYGVPILDAYGATEFAGGVAGWTWPDYQQWGKAKRGSVGRANKGVSLRVVDRDSGEPLPAGQLGLLEVRAAQLGSADWVRTTDLAELDEDGFLFIRGRADDAIIRGGFKVLPTAVADVLRRHPAIFDACVVGLPDDRLGAVPVAAVEIRPGHAAPTESELIGFLREQLVAYQVPVRLLVVEQLPRTPSMKVSQPEVRRLFTAPASI